MQTEWDAIAERIHRSGEPGAPLHLKIKTFHVDIARNEARCQGLKLDDLGSIAVPRQYYLRRIDADGKQPLVEVKAEVTAMACRYFHLVLAEQTKDRHRAEVARGLISTLEVYESFHSRLRQPTWAAEDERVKLSDEEGGKEEIRRKISSDSSVVYMQVVLQVDGM